MTLILFVVAIDRSIYTTTVTYGYRCGRTINTTCCVNDTGDIHTCSLSSSLFSSISCLFIDIVLIVSFRGISCCLDNRYFGHNSHLLLHVDTFFVGWVRDKRHAVDPDRFGQHSRR